MNDLAEMFRQILLKLEAVEHRLDDGRGLKDLILRLTTDLARHAAQEEERFQMLEARIERLEDAEAKGAA
jgi:hypothetical protein